MLARVSFLPLLKVGRLAGFFEQADFERVVSHLPEAIADVARFAYLRAGPTKRNVTAFPDRNGESRIEPPQIGVKGGRRPRRPFALSRCSVLVLLWWRGRDLKDLWVMRPQVSALGDDGCGGIVPQPPTGEVKHEMRSAYQP